MNKKRKKLRKIVQSSLNDLLDRLRTLKDPDDRYHIFLERGEWVFFPLNEIEEDILYVPNFDDDVSNDLRPTQNSL